MTSRRGLVKMLAAGAAALGLPNIELASGSPPASVGIPPAVPPASLPPSAIPQPGAALPVPLCWMQVQECMVGRSIVRPTTFTAEGWKDDSSPGPIIVEARFIVPQEHEAAYMAWLALQTERVV